ncbi:MAG: isoprenylcysteine carboxylmethyltransferase family protein [Bacteroidia bacterium]|nr:isoprenylcysteine carboxylmethyltransferase family protein [Bacteroidia bacterium]NND50913.1 isoprenylcysteine carboxylmethyltransferase family protein [Flavobacteriaceae bacterium]
MRNNSLLSHLLSIIILPGTVTLLIPYLLNEYLKEPTIYNEHIVLKLGGMGFMGFGLILFLICLIYFISVGKGTLAPWTPTRNLVVSGPYRYVRNPMIIAILSILLGEALYLNSISVLVWGMLFFLINTVYFELIEEPKLERKFGEDYARYKRKVGRWMPNTRPYEME